MKRRVLIGALCWMLLITAAHVQLNVGWRKLGRELSILFGATRQELVVGFLPVT